MENGEPQRAIALFRQVLRRNSGDAKAWNDLGSIYLQQNDLAQARECYEKGVAADPALAISYRNLGVLHLTLALRQKDPGGLQKALDFFNQAIERDAGLASAYNGRASVHRFLRRVPEALADWKKALELDPEMSEPYFNLGLTYLEAGDKSEALRYFQRCQQKLGNTLAANEKSRLRRLIAEAEKK
jgi:tetratricopeptide (TPR) repeat protein